jgi:ubiquinone/menaquinone biosynthesis C-methylase UbiE
LASGDGKGYAMVTDVFNKDASIEQWDVDYYLPTAQRYYDHAIARMLTYLAPPPGEPVLDAGCRPGVHANRTARLAHQVVAIDISATMLAEARRRTEMAAVAGRVTFQQGDLTQLQWPDASFAAVYT